MDKLDKEIINLIQSAFPVEHQPYEAIGKRLNIPVDEAWQRIKALRAKGIIRRIGAVFKSKRLGFTSTLVGIEADPRFIEEIARKINTIKGVTHHYQRDDQFNLWFTLTAREQKNIDGVLEEIKGLKGVKSTLNLPAKKTFKIKVDFQVKDE